MTKLENKAFKLIQDNHGITLESLTTLLDRNLSSVKKTLKTLHYEGHVSHWHDGLYPNYRSIVIYKKGEEEECEEIMLTKYLSPKRISKFIEHVEDDHWYCNNYLINENSKILFEKSNGVRFDLEKFNYFLCYTLDNTNDINKQ
jgi:predicted transcriptional regulator